MSGEFSTSDPTYRGEQYCGSWFCLDPSGDAYDEFIANGRPERLLMQLIPLSSKPPKRVGIRRRGTTWGKPHVDSMRFFYNAGIPLSDRLELYSYGNYSDSDSDGSFFYRSPLQRNY